MLAIQSINGRTLPIQPLADGFSVISSDLLSSGSGRSAETGRALRYLIRPDTKKINLKFKGLAEDVADVNEIVKEFAGKPLVLYCSPN